MERGMSWSVTMMAEQFGNMISFPLVKKQENRSKNGFFTSRSALEIFLWIME